MGQGSDGAGGLYPALVPWHDWQFWVVTLVALLAAGYLLRRVLPARWVGRGGKGARTSLTIEGKPAQRRGE